MNERQFVRAEEGPDNSVVYEKHVISELLASTSAGREWIKKAEAIILAEGGLLDAIVVHANRAIYLRPKFHRTSFRQMNCK